VFFHAQKIYLPIYLRDKYLIKIIKSRKVECKIRKWKNVATIGFLRFYKIIEE